MANTFTRFPIPGGDLNVGANYNEAQLYGVLGALSGRLYNDGGALKVPLCRIGIDNGTYKGISDIDTITTVSLAGCSNSNWLAIEMSVAGSAVSFSATDIAGATDPTIIPASVKAAWDGRKLGYYLTATKRLIGLAWLNSGGVLLAVVNFEGPKIWASQIGLHTGTIHEQALPKEGFLLSTGDWNMDTTASINISHAFGVFFKAVKNVLCWVRRDGDDVYYPMDLFVGQMDGGISTLTSTQITLVRRGGGIFDAVDFDLTPFNRGWLNWTMRDF